MFKLVILIENLPDHEHFDTLWPEFLHVSERMPGLIKEATCRVDSNLYGSYQPIMQHELYFESIDAIQLAMSSPDGQAAGGLLQQMTGGRMSLFIADHKEDDLENIRRYREESPDAE